MNRIKSLGVYQKIILLFMIVMVLVFAVLYSVTIAKEGFEYRDAILLPQQNNETAVYAGKIQGKQTVFTVSADKTVQFQHGDTVYGPYTVREDDSAVPSDTDIISNLTGHMKGIEILQGTEILFRGGIMKFDDDWVLYNEDGSLESMGIFATTNKGVVLDAEGNRVDPMEPTVSDILTLAEGPELTHKGNWYAWFCGTILCCVAAVTILFADELFRRNLSFQIRNADKAEPSDWEIAGRYIEWTVLPIVAFVVFIIGLS